MEIKKVTVLGGGVLGSQIALMCAYCGYDTTIWLWKEEEVPKTQAKLEHYSSWMLDDLNAAKLLIEDPLGAGKYPRGLITDWAHISSEAIDKLAAMAKESFADKLYIELDLEASLSDVDFVIEAISEDQQAKTDLFRKISNLLPERTILVSNSSTLVPSLFAEHTGRPEKFCAMHFANTIWKCNTTEIMSHEKTDPQIYEQVVRFAESLHMIPLQLHKEQRGYILNSLLVPWLAAGEALWVNGIATPETIDLTWRAGLGCPFGPFEHIDVIGLETVYNINLAKPEASVEGSVINRLNKMLKEKIDKGETGINAGVGFYDYRTNG